MRIAPAIVLALAACQSAPGPESPLDSLIPPILERDRIPAAVVVVGDADRVTYRRAFGTATPETVFDLASCTKVVATTTAAMLLVEEGLLSLEDPVGKYLEAFSGKPVTLRDLLIHCSGLPAYLTPKTKSPETILHEISDLPLGAKKLTYSCLNMILLARVVEEVTGQPLGYFARSRIFAPLGMKDTGFDPDPARCAPTSGDPPGVVHDPLARAYIAGEHQPGNAGLFSTGDDLARFCQALLRGRLLKPQTVGAMFAPATGGADARGLGWDVFDQPPFRPGVGHTGFTGTLLWLDPPRGRFCVLLTNRIYSGERTDVTRLRREVIAAVSRLP
jgi:CubicO group peptidase (beta-lactamase class C family)